MLKAAERVLAFQNAKRRIDGIGDTIPHYWTVEERAEAVPPKPGVAKTTITRWCASGRLKAYQAGRVWLIPNEVAEAFIAELQERWR